jgi:hypothetical protein
VARESLLSVRPPRCADSMHTAESDAPPHSSLRSVSRLFRTGCKRQLTLSLIPRGSLAWHWNNAGRLGSKCLNEIKVAIAATALDAGARHAG